MAAMTGMTLVSVVDSSIELRLFEGEESGMLPMHGRAAFVQSISTHLRASPDVEIWWAFDGRSWFDVREGRRLVSRPSLDSNSRCVYFNPFRQYGLKSHVMRLRLGMAGPVVCFGHSVGYGDWLTETIAALSVPMEPYDVVVFPSSKSRDAYLKLCEKVRKRFGVADNPPTRVEVLSYATPFAPLNTRSTIQPFRVVTLGRLDAIEKFDFASYGAALRDNAALFDNLRVTLVGTASNRAVARFAVDTLRSASGLEVDVFENATPAVKAQVLNESALMVQPTNCHAESFGLALVEGVRANLPIVASRFSGQVEAVGAYGDVTFVDGNWDKTSPPEGFEQSGAARGGRLDVHSLSAALSTALALRSRKRARSVAIPPYERFAESVVRLLLDAQQHATAFPTLNRTEPSKLEFEDIFSGYWND